MCAVAGGGVDDRSGRGGSGGVDPGQLDSYGRAAAELAGLAVAEEWWPGVLGYLALIVDEAAKVDAVDVSPIDQPAPVFEA